MKCLCQEFVLAPLRKVVIAGAIFEKYECGHVAGVKDDIFGSTNAARRRCIQCAREGHK